MAEEILRAVELIRQQRKHLTSARIPVKKRFSSGPIKEVGGSVHYEEGRLYPLIYATLRHKHPVVDHVSYRPHEKLGNAFLITFHSKELAWPLTSPYEALGSLSPGFREALRLAGYQMIDRTDWSGDILVKHGKKPVAYFEGSNGKIQFLHVRESHVKPLIRLLLGEHKLLPPQKKRS